MTGNVIDGAGPPTMTVLVVEDNPSVASLLQRGLEREGYSVDLASDGSQALAMGVTNTYVAIVLDVMIPAPDGRPAAEAAGLLGPGPDADRP